MKRDFLMKVIVSLFTVAALCSCNKDEKSVLPDEEIFEDYIFIDKCEESGEWDYSVLGLNGLAFFYKFQENNLPEEVRIWDGNETENEKAVSIIVRFDEKGMPHSLIAGDYTFVFANFNENKFDVAIFSGRDELSFLKEVESDINWSEYLTEISHADTRAYNISHSPMKWVNAVVGAIGCGLSIASSPTGFGIALTVISCTGAIISIVDLFTDDIPTSVSLTSAGIGHYANFANCAKNPYALTSCFIGLISNVTQAGDLIFDDRRENIDIAEDALMDNETFTIVIENGDIYNGEITGVSEDIYHIYPVYIDHPQYGTIIDGSETRYITTIATVPYINIGFIPIILPKNISKQYLQPITDIFHTGYELNISNPNVKGCVMFLNADKSGTGLFHGTEDWLGYFIYADENISITGVTYIISEYYNWDVHLKKGWNIMYNKITENPYSEWHTTQVPAGAKWYFSEFELE